MITVQPEGFVHDNRGDMRQYGKPVHTVTMTDNGQTVQCEFYTGKDGGSFLVIRHENGDFVHEVSVADDGGMVVDSPYADLSSNDRVVL
jgi:hypothetical protein